MSDARDIQRPIAGRSDTYGDIIGCAMHPAVRLGFLDAQHGRPFDHDRILQRIRNETPASALDRIDWPAFDAMCDVALAQFRYEEGRMLHVEVGLKCRGWGHPDYPPVAVREWAWSRSLEARQEAA